MRFFTLLTAVSCLLLCAAEDGVFSVNLVKKPLDLQRVAEQRQAIQGELLARAANGGEDIPLIDFMDAQVMHLEYSAYCDRLRGSL